MDDRGLHPSLEELLMYADGELSARATRRVAEHTASCSECAARLRELEEASDNFAAGHTLAITQVENTGDISGPRALLKARLAEAASLGPRFEHGSDMGLVLRGLAYGCALAVVLAAGVFLVKQDRFEPAPQARLLPDPAFTPGMTRAVRLAELCSSDHDEVVRAVPAALEQRVFREYGIEGKPAAEYEVDYLITPGLGGAEDVRNLWPQPHGHTVWNSYAKDALEDHLHGMVCAGGLSLETAQREIASDWIAAYKKYFHTERPLKTFDADRLHADPLYAEALLDLPTALRRKQPRE